MKLFLKAASELSSRGVSSAGHPEFKMVSILGVDA
jgi:hypothetical protein